MRRIKVCVVGAMGRMGLETTKLLRRSDKFECALAISRESLVEGFKKTKKNFSEIGGKEIDVIIDFSSPEFLKKTIQFAIKNQVPLVAGVTGLNSTEMKFLKEAAKKTAILYAPNMSMGIAILRSALELFSDLKGFDFQIVEAHHRNKKDQPSGTAIFLQQALEKSTRKKLPRALSIRGGGIIGDHQVLAMSEHEIIKFQHQALNRTVFAQGALSAAEWICKNKNGYFEMKDVLLGVSIA